MLYLGVGLRRLKHLLHHPLYHVFISDQVFCLRCCSQKARLAYDSNRLNRVCDECYIIIRNRDLGESEWETAEVRFKGT